MGVITITTDFGHKGPFVAVMKGVILSRYPEAKIVDLMHDIPAQWPPEAGFWVCRSYRWFPAGSIHLAIVDPGVGTERDILIVEHEGHLFMAPDNGLLGQLLDTTASARVYRLDMARLDLPEPSATFHGRDIFAPVAAVGILVTQMLSSVQLDGNLPVGTQQIHFHLAPAIERNR